MIGSMKRLWKDRRGNALAIAAGAFPLLVGAAGLAADTIQWTLWKRELQRAADSAAIAGVYDRVGNNSALAAVTAVVNHDLTINHHTGIGLVTNYPQVSLPADAGDLRDQVRVVLAVTKPLPFSSMFMSAAPVIIARSTAASVPGGDEYCVVALETLGNKTGIVVGGNAKIDMNCGFISNSPSLEKSAINNGNASSVHASVFASVGGLQHSTNWTIDKYDPGTSAAEDPYASVDPKNDSELGDCAANPPAFTETTVVPAGTTHLCVSALTIGSTTTNVPMSDGTALHDVKIYVTGKNKNTAGNVLIQGNMTCERCTIILTNKDPDPAAKIGTFDMRAGSTLDMSAQTSGEYAGIAVMQDRRQTDSNGSGAPNKFNGTGTQIIEGALYFPRQEIEYSGDGTNTAVCTRFVGRRVTFTGNSTTFNRFEKGSNCDIFDHDGIGGGRRVRLVA